MSRRHILVLALTPVVLIVVGLVACIALTWPYAPTAGEVASRLFLRPQPRASIVPRYDGTKPFALKVEGMPGVKLYLDPNDLVITPAILRVGSWEPAETAWFLRVVRPGDLIVDAGANVGYYTIIGSRLVGDKGRVYAFEPEPESFALLQENVRLNGLSNVVLERKALSNRTGKLRLFIAPLNKGDHRIYQPEGESRASVEVEAVRLDEYFADQERGIDLIKMDTQGAEGLILEGMTGLLEGRTDRPTLFMEFWPYGLSAMGTEADALLQTLESYHYRFYESPRADRTRLRRVEPQELLAAYFARDPNSQTDLMALRGGREPP
jgi:FkbM family methyltransferase